MATFSTQFPEDSPLSWSSFSVEQNAGSLAPRVLQYVAVQEEGTQANLDSIDGTIPIKST